MCDDCDNDYTFLCNYPGSVNTCRPHRQPHHHTGGWSCQSSSDGGRHCVPGFGGQYETSYECQQQCRQGPLGPGGLPPRHPHHPHNLGPGGQHRQGPLGPGGLHPNHPHHPHNLGPGGQHRQGPLGPGGTHGLNPRGMHLPPHVYEGYDDTKINFYFMDGCGFCEKAKKAIKAAGKEHLFNYKSKNEAPKGVGGFPYFEKGNKNVTGFKANIDELLAELN